MEIRKAIDAYLDYCEGIRRLDHKTIKAYRCDLLQFAEWLECYLASRGEEGQDPTEAYIRHLNEQYKPKSVRRKAAAVRAFVRRMGAQATELAPFAKMEIHAREPKELPRTVRNEDLRKMLRRAQAELADAKGVSPHSTFIAARALAMIELLVATGMRISELCALNNDDVDLYGRTLRIMGKGSRERVVQLECQATLDAVWGYLAARNAYFAEARTHGESQRLFVNRDGAPLTDHVARLAIEQLGERARASAHVTPHMVRHTFATLLLEQDVDIRFIQRLLGHSSIRTTEIYTHVSSAKQREIMRTKNPRTFIDGSRNG